MAPSANFARTECAFVDGVFQNSMMEGFTVTVQAVLFDLDNTLVDRNRSLRAYAKRFMDAFSSNLEEDDVERVFSLMVEADHEGHITRDEFFGRLVEMLPWVQTPNIHELSTHWFSNFPQCSEVFDDVLDTLNVLHAKGIILGIVTNGKDRVQNEKIDVIGVRSYMRSVVVSGAVNVKKPDERIFNIALSEIDCDPSRTWFVGDHPTKDVVGASSVGMTTVWIRHGRNWDSEHTEPNFEINRFSELLTLVDQR